MNGNQQMPNWNMPTAVNANQMQQQMYPQAQQMQMMQQGNPQMVQNQQPQQVFMQPQAQTPSYIPGRFIQTVDEIRPNEIPMDGTPTSFLLSDGSAIVVKRWTQNGTIDTRIYMLHNEQQPEAPADSALSEFREIVNDRFDSLERLIKKNNRPYYNNNKKKEDKQ